MRTAIIVKVVEAIVDIIMFILKRNEEKEQELKDREDRVKEDAFLADQIRAINPGMSDSDIIKEYA